MPIQGHWAVSNFIIDLLIELCGQFLRIKRFIHHSFPAFHCFALHSFQFLLRLKVGGCGIKGQRLALVMNKNKYMANYEVFSRFFFKYFFFKF